MLHIACQNNASGYIVHQATLKNIILIGVATSEAVNKPDVTRLMHMFFNMSPDLLCVAGFDGYFRMVNPAVCHLLEYTEDELMQRPVNAFVHPDDRDITSSMRADLVNNKPLYNFDNRYITKSGKVVWLSWTSLPVPQEQLVFAVAKHISHRKKLEQERNQLIENLTRINNDLKLLTYSATHDLRSPVNNMLATFSMLDSNMVSEADTEMFLKLLQSSANKLYQTLNAYLDNMRHRQTETLMEMVVLQAVLNDVLAVLDKNISDAGATVTADFTGAKALWFNRNYLFSIFLNLVSNSIKYARPGVPPHISISSAQNHTNSILTVADNGLGFDMEAVGDRIFGLHQKFHYHADSKGVGLYLVYNYVTSLGGTIAVHSAPQQGATFTIHLPLPPGN